MNVLMIRPTLDHVERLAMQLPPADRRELLQRLTRAQPPEPLKRKALREIEPVSVGETLRPYPHPDDDILDEMING
jgi:hypothetical protein